MHSSSFPIMTFTQTDAQPLAWKMFLNVLSSNSLFITGEFMEGWKWLARGNDACWDALEEERKLQWLFLYKCQKSRGTCAFCTRWHRALAVLRPTMFIIRLKVEDVPFVGWMLIETRCRVDASRVWSLSRADEAVAASPRSSKPRTASVVRCMFMSA